MGCVPVYLFCGCEIGEKNEAILDLKIKARKKYGVLDEYSFYAHETRIADVVALLLNESLFASGRFVVLNCAEQIKKKEDFDLLDTWVKSAVDSSSTLVLVSEENSCDKKLESLVPKENKRIFWEMFDNRKEQWLVAFFNKNGYNVTPEAVDLILDMVENNTEALRCECSRFFLCFQRGYVVTEDDVENLLSHNKEESAFTLFDSMCDVSRSTVVRLEAALAVLQKIRLSKESSSVQLIAGLAYCFRRLRIWHVFLTENPCPSEFDLKTKGFASKKVQRQYSNASKIWNLSAVHNILALLARGDMEIRKTGFAIEETILNLLIYSIVLNDGLPIEDFQLVG